MAPLDLSLAVGIIGLCSALALAQTPLLVGKARMSGVLFQLAEGRGAAVEHFALHGELLAPDPAGRADADAAAGGFAIRHSGSSVIASGTLRPGGAPFELAFNPAVGVADLGWSVVWLCGLRRAPPGLQAAAPPLATALTAEQLPFVCREALP